MFDFARRWLAIIQAQLQNLDRAQKLLIGSLSIIVVMALFLVMQYAATPELRELISLPEDAEQRTAIINYLDTNNVNYKLEGNQIMVAPESRQELMAQLAVNNLIPQGAETSRAFEKMLASQHWSMNNKQNQMHYIVALQDYLGSVIGHMGGVRKASVVVADPEFRRIGRPNTRPTASVTVTMEDGRKMNGRLARSIAALVAGAKAEMRIEDVNVVDAATGRLWDGDTDDMTGGDIEEKRLALEKIYRQKIDELIKVPNSVVAVNISLSRGHKSVSDYDVGETTGVLNEKRTRDMTSTNEGSGGVPGAQSNLTERVTARGSQNRTEESETEERYTPMADATRIDVKQSAGAERQVNVSVNVPYSYLVGVYQLKTGNEDRPTDTELLEVRTKEMEAIQKMIDNLLKDESIPQNVKGYDVVRAGNVHVASYYDVPLGTGTEGEVATAGAYPNLFGVPMNGTAWLAILSVVSIAMMLFMVFRASKRPKMASIHELAGIPETPPTMPEADEMVGELGDAGGVLEGLELDDEDLKREKILNQVRDLIHEHPEEAAMLVTRWASQGA